MFQFWNGPLDTAQRPLCTEPVEFAGRAGAHQTFDQAQAIALERDFQVQLIRSGLEPWARNEQQLARIVEQDYVRWDKIIRDANIPTT